jgi:hypothetical protein
MLQLSSKCLERKKGENKTQQEIVAMAEEDDFSKKFEDEVFLVSQLSIGTLLASVWLIDSGVTCHMI